MTYIFRSRSFAPPCSSTRAAARLLRLATLLALVVLTNSAFAQDLASLDKVLMPVLNLKPITGANGSTFLTLLSVYTQNRGTVGFYPAMLSVNQVVEGPGLRADRQPASQSAVLGGGAGVEGPVLLL